MGYINIAQLFNVAFGIKQMGAYKVDDIDKKPTDLQINYKGVDVVESLHDAVRMSHLGTPIILPLTLKGKKYQVFNEVGDVIFKQYEDFEMPAATLVNFRRAKIITKTKARAAKGTVKEMYGFDDWRIDIRGFCLSDGSHPTSKTAYNQKLNLYKYDNIIDSVEVVSELFNDIDISNIVIEELNFSQLKGKPGVIPFYMRCVSDEPLELIL